MNKVSGYLPFITCYHTDSFSLSGAPVLGTFVQISWTGRVLVGHRSTFTCSSSCFPNCTYTWNLKGRTINGNTLTWTPDGLDDTVELQCSVHNPGTGMSSSTTTILEIKSKLYPVGQQLSIFAWTLHFTGCIQIIFIITWFFPLTEINGMYVMRDYLMDSPWRVH